MVGNISQYPMLIFTFIVMICYNLCGLVGVLAAFTGFILNIMILLPILFLAGVSHESSRISTIA